MNALYAQNPRQLGICLKLLYSENISWIVDIYEDNKGRIRYKISVQAEDIKFDEIKEKYRILIS